jgi:hypothetical protein
VSCSPLNLSGEMLANQPTLFCDKGISEVAGNCCGSLLAAVGGTSHARVSTLMSWPAGEQ